MFRRDNHSCAFSACKEESGQEDCVEDAAEEGEEGGGKCQNVAEDLILALVNKVYKEHQVKLVYQGRRKRPRCC